MKRRKFLFYSILSILFILAIAFILGSGSHKPDPGKQHITVGICGCIKKDGVYRLPKNSDLATLVMAAQGITSRGDIRETDLGVSLQNDSIYHIPCRKDNTVIPWKPDNLGDFHVKYPNHNERLINYLYIGFPAVYMLIQYSSEYKLINIIYLPHSTVFMDNDYRLIDIFFTLGIEPTIRILENELNQKIDYYFIQNKPAFITMIDNLGGIEVSVDRVFADAYGLKNGNVLLDGWHAYEYISFIDQKRHYRAKPGTKAMSDLQFELKDIELAYDLRQERQLRVIQSLHRVFNTEDPSLRESQEVIGAILSKGTLDSNLDLKSGSEIFRILMEGAEISYGTLPGYYTRQDENVYYIPDGPGYDLLRNRETRALFELNRKNGTQTLY